MFATFVPWSGQAIPAFANLRAERKLIGTLGATGDYYGQIDECKAVWENISGQTWPPPGGYVPNSGPWASPLTTAPDSELKRLFLDYLSTYDRVLVNPCISTGQRASAKASAVDDALVSREAAILSRLYSMRQSAERYDVAWQWPMGWDLPT
jgi:hypothetical protein